MLSKREILDDLSFRLQLKLEDNGNTSILNINQIKEVLNDYMDDLEN